MYMMENLQALKHFFQLKNQATLCLIIKVKPTYHSILQRCHKLKMIECSRKLLLPHVYLHPIHVVPNPTFNGKLEVNVRKIAAALGLASCVVSEIAQ